MWVGQGRRRCLACRHSSRILSGSYLSYLKFCLCRAEGKENNGVSQRKYEKLCRYSSFLDNQVPTVWYTKTWPIFPDSVKINRVTQLIECDCDWFCEILKGTSLNCNESKSIAFYGKETGASFDSRTSSESLSLSDQIKNQKSNFWSLVLLYCYVPYRSEYLSMFSIRTNYAYSYRELHA